jgi:hypothetical protein
MCVELVVDFKVDLGIMNQAYVLGCALCSSDVAKIKRLKKKS